MKAYYDTQGNITLAANSIVLNLPFIEVTEVNFLKPKIDLDTLELYESATAQELAEATEQARDNFIKGFMQKKEQDGKAYADTIRFQITKELIGKLIAEVNEIDGQTKVTVMPLLELIENKGDYWTAMNLAMTITAPTNAIALRYFNELKGYIINYVQSNYPTE